LTDPTGSKWQQGLSDDILHLVSNSNTFDAKGQQRATSISYAVRPSVRRSSSTNSNLMLSRSNRFQTASIESFNNPQTSLITEEPLPISTPTAESSIGNYYATQNQTQGESNTRAQLQGLPLSARRRVELQLRVNKARDEIPLHIKLRIFKDPLECTEIEEILYNLHM
jgi:hypothetical protein